MSEAKRLLRGPRTIERVRFPTVELPHTLDRMTFVDCDLSETTIFAGLLGRPKVMGCVFDGGVVVPSITGARLTNVEFRACEITGNFTRAQFRGCRMINVDFGRTDFLDCELRECRLDGLRGDGFGFSGGRIVSTTIAGELEDVGFRWTSFEDASLAGLRVRHGMLFEIRGVVDSHCPTTRTVSWCPVTRCSPPPTRSRHTSARLRSLLTSGS